MMDPSSMKMDLNHLAYYLQRVRTFVESSKKTLSFPRISDELKDVLVKITTEDPQFLKSSQFSKTVNLEAEKLISALNIHVDNEIKLKHKFEDGKHGPNTLVYTKMEVITCKPLEPLRQPCIAQTSTTDIPLGDSHVTPVFKTSCLNITTAFVKDDSRLIMKYPEMAKDQAEFIMNMVLPGIKGKMEKAEIGFGYRSMYAPLWESMKLFSLKYDFKIHCVDLTNSVSKRVLFEKIPKRDLDIPPKQSVAMTKTPKTKPPDHQDLDILVPPKQSVAMTKTPKTKPPDHQDVDIPVPPKQSIAMTKTPKTKPPDHQDVDIPVPPKQNSLSAIPTAPSASKSTDNLPKVPTFKKKKAKKLIVALEVPIRTKKLTEQFMKTSLQRVLNFLRVEIEASIIFEQMNEHQIYFLQHAGRLSHISMGYMLFSVECQKLLHDIKHCLITTKIQYKTSFIKGSKTGTKTTTLRDLKFEKIVVLPKVKVVKQIPDLKIMTAYYSKYMQGLNEKNEREINTPVHGKMNERIIDKPVHEKKNDPINNKLVKKKSTKDDSQESKCPLKPLWKDQQETLFSLKAIKVNVVRTSGEKCILQIIKKYLSFTTTENSADILTFKRMTDHQAAFIKNVQTFAENNETYPLFSMECQGLLADIKLKVVKHQINMESVDEEIGAQIYTTITFKKVPAAANTKIQETTEVTITKKPIKENQEVPKRARSLSAGRRKKAEGKAGGRTARGISSGRVSRSQAKLIEGLAQPVQSDKAMRIMQSMGWTGGALGPRGNGIIEPIRPAIDQVTRAGFGHVPPPPKPKPKPAKSKSRLANPVVPKDNAHESRMEVPETDLLPFGVLPVNCLLPTLIPPGILPTGVPNMLVKTVQLRHPYASTVLDSILELMLNEKIGTVEFIYSVCVQQKSKKLVDFIVEIVTSFNQRKLIDVRPQRQRQLAGNILKVSQNSPDVQLTTELYDKNCLLRKCLGAPTNNNDNTKNNNVAANTRNVDKITNENGKDIPCIDLTGPFVTHTYKKVPTNRHLDNIMTVAKGVPKNNKNDIVNTQNDGVGDLSSTNKSNTEINDDIIMETDDIVPKNDPNRHINGKSYKTDDKTDQTDRNDTATYIILIDEFIETDVTTNNIITFENENVVEPNRNQVVIDETNINGTESTGSVIVDNRIGKFLQTDVVTPNNIVAIESETIGYTDKTQIEIVKTNNITDKVESKIDESNSTQVEILTFNNIVDDVEIEMIDKTDNKIVKTNSVTNIEMVTTEKLDNTPVEMDTTNNYVNNDSEIGKTELEVITTEKSKNAMLVHSATIEDPNKTRTNIVTTNNTNDVKTERDSTEANDIEICDIMSNIKIEKRNDKPKNKSEGLLDNSTSTIEIDSDEEDNLLMSDQESETVAIIKNNKANQKTCKIAKPRKSLDSLEFQDAIDALENLDDNSKVNKTEKDISKAAINHGKRPIECPGSTAKKHKLLADYKKLCIVPKDSRSTIDNGKAREIQTSILEAIDYTKDLPLLKCEGILNGGLMYSCHDENSLFFMEDLIKKIEDLRIVYEFDVKDKVSHKMAFKINSFIDENVNDLLVRLDLYNKGLCSSKWRVIKKEQHCDFLVIYVEIDNTSFVFIRNANFTLYAGNDCVNFSFVWD